MRSESTEQCHLSISEGDFLNSDDAGCYDIKNVRYERRGNVKRQGKGATTAWKKLLLQKSFYGTTGPEVSPKPTISSISKAPTTIGVLKLRCVFIFQKLSGSR